MLIVSQNREMIINVDNISVIGLMRPQEHTTHDREIWCKTIDGDSHPLGKYKDKKMCITVLKNFFQHYADLEENRSFGISRGGRLEYVLDRIYRRDREFSYIRSMYGWW